MISCHNYGDNIILRVEQSYDSENQRTRQIVKFADGISYTNSNTYNPNGTPMGMVSGVVGTGYSYDGLTRVTQIDSEINVIDRQYTYRTNPNTNQVKTLKYPSLKGGYNFDYTYDNMGNIKTYELDCVNNRYDEAKFTYTYDSQNQLLNATDGTLTFSYSYDNAGNITEANGHTYTYGDTSWGDLLTAYDEQSISYDEIGNPTSYYNGTRWNFTWKHGRQLATASNGTNSISYTYDHDGLRTSKTVNGVVYNYYYVGSQLARMTYSDYVLDFFYDVNGTPIAMRQGYASNNNYTVYYYITNLQGDVIRLVDVYGNTAAYYEYDPYGNAIQAAGSHCNINPLRYRGYVYDTETGLYYVSSRYYDPEIGRFVNADDTAYLGADGTMLSNNLFAYCGNNPVNKIDKTGNLGLAIGLFIGASAVIGGLAGAFTAACTGSNVLEGALEGAALGAVAATATIVAPLLLPTTASTAVTVGVTFAAAGAGGMVVDYTTQRVSHELGENSNEEFVLNKGRLIKTGLTTGIAGVVPTYGNPSSSVLNAIGSLVMGFDASFFNAAAEITITHFLM